MEDMQLWHGDCLEEMGRIADGSVDMVLCDPPYGTVKGLASGANIEHGMKGKTGWDDAIDHAAMLEQCNRILRPNGSLVLFSQDPYTGKLMTEQHGNLPFSYRLVWLKDHFANALIAKKAPVNYAEDICVFFKRHAKHDFQGFHPLRTYAKKVADYIGRPLRAINSNLGHRRAEHFFYIHSTQFAMCTELTYGELTGYYGLGDMEGFRTFESLSAEDKSYRAKLMERMAEEFPKTFNLPEGKKYKSNVLQYAKDYTGLHPTQKPVALMEDLLRTYTNFGDTVLDFAAGSFTTGVACKNLGRKFIGIEKDAHCFEVGKWRVEEA